MNVQTARRVSLRSPTEPRPHHDCDKPDKPCRRHRRETSVYRIKLKRISAVSSGAASLDQHLSSPETRRCFHADYGENDSMRRPLCFARWDKIFTFRDIVADP
jgi:hypothetical protein